jgi:transketolase
MDTQTKEMRAAYVDTLIALAAEDPRLVCLEADLMSSSGTKAFQKVYPDRLINAGVAEADMIGIAAGLSAAGKLPFATTFACFASRRCFDQFFLSANYAKLNVKLAGTDPGITAAFNGGTHMPFEDLALMRVVPKLTIVEPSDPRSCEAFTRLAAAKEGCVYLRLQRKPAPYLYPEGEKFEFGKAKLLRPGKDAVIIALGCVMVGEALKAADILKSRGLEAAVLDALSVKPLDKDAILSLARSTGRVVTAENHQLEGGFGDAVATLLAENAYGGKFARIGVREEFGEVGTVDFLKQRFKLTAEDIAAAVEGLR